MKENSDCEEEFNRLEEQLVRFKVELILGLFCHFKPSY